MPSGELKLVSLVSCLLMLLCLSVSSDATLFSDEVLELEGTELSTPGTVITRETRVFRPGLGLVPFTTTSNELKAVSGLLRDALLSAIETRDYELYTQEMSALVNHQQVSNTDYYTNGIQPGQFKTAGFLVLGKFYKLDRLYYLNTKLVNAQSGQILKTNTAKFGSMEDALRRIDWVAYELSLRDKQPKTPPVDLNQMFNMTTVTTVAERFQQQNAGKPVTGKMPAKAWDLKIKVFPEREVYDEKDEVQFQVNSNKDCYVTLIQVDAKGNTALLLPNDFAPAARVRAGRVTKIPSDTAGFLIGVGEPHGVTYVKAIATTRPIRLESANQQLKKLGPFTDLGNITNARAFKIKAREDTGQWSWAELNVRTVKTRADIKAVQAVKRQQRFGAAQVQKAPAQPAQAIQPGAAMKQAKKALRPPLMPSPDANDHIARNWQQASRRILQPGTIFSATGSIIPAKPSKHAEFIILRNAQDRFGELLRLKPEQAVNAQGLSDRVAELKQLLGASLVLPNRSVGHFNDNMHMLAGTAYSRAQWALLNEAYPGNDIGWAKVQDEIKAIQGSLVGVVDSGLSVQDTSIRKMAWRNRKEFANNGQDDDDNGYVDDLYGANVADPSQPLYVKDATFNHGTFVSSIIASPVNSRETVIGISPNTRIVSANVFASKKESTVFHVLKGIAYCMDAGARVINLSLGQEMPMEEIRKISQFPLFDELEARGVILVVAAGNHDKDIDKHPVFPASIQRDNIITVMSIDPSARRGHTLAPKPGGSGVRHQRGGEGGSILGSQRIEGFSSSTQTPIQAGTHVWKQYSNYGRKTVHLAAPGTMIVGIAAPGKIAIDDGTSYAAPIVTAAISLLQGKHPDWDYRMIKRAILESARPVTSLRFQCQTGGTLDLEAALKYKH